MNWTPARVDCGHDLGISGRYISIQMLERPGGTEEDRLEVVEVEVEGWRRSCGETPGTSSHPSLY